MSWRIAFCGTYHVAVPTLRELLRREWVAVIVMPKSAGAKNDELIALAQAHGVPTTYRIRDIDDYDVNLLLAANYPKLIPQRYLDALPAVNTHWSALPKYRGIHGTAWALLNADYSPAVSMHWMEGEFDTGDIIAQAQVTVTPEMDIDDLHVQLGERQAEVVLSVLETPEIADWPRTKQDHTQATYVPQRVPGDGLIHWHWPTERIWNLVRALPLPKYPGAFSYLDDQELVIVAATPAPCPAYVCTPGQVVRVVDDAVWIKTGDTCLAVQTVKLADGESVPAATLLKRGDRLGYEPEAEIHRLRRTVADLGARLAALEARLEGRDG